MTRKTAADFDQELLILFDAYVHGAIDRRGFLDRAQKFAVGGVTASMLLASLSPNFARTAVANTLNLAVIPGDGTGPDDAVKVARFVCRRLVRIPGDEDDRQDRGSREDEHVNGVRQVFRLCAKRDG